MKIFPKAIIKNNNTASEVPDHLGGHANRNWTDGGALEYFYLKHNVRSMIDIGCGTGEQSIIAQKNKIHAVGVDGDFSLDRSKLENFILHDYSKGPLGLNICKKMGHLPESGFFDLGWSIEFLEHVEEKYVPNFMETFKMCKLAIVTHAHPGQGGHHHVNEQEREYWVDIFKKYGFELDEGILKEVLLSSTMVKKNMKTREDPSIKLPTTWLELNGSVFVNKDIKNRKII